jgi:hypothetical protein
VSFVLDAPETLITAGPPAAIDRPKGVVLLQAISFTDDTTIMMAMMARHMTDRINAGE